ncbi:MAG TPA: Rrf2 family transcriptional regulator [Firmicutes bacterium]|nr:Rrf2 family transcriptional regulator [Bacillota bacterium]
MWLADLAMISKSAIQAIRALTLLARLPENEFADARALAEKTGGASNYLGKLLQSLSRDGIVVSRKGLGGGFRLARPAKSISLLDIVDSIDPVVRWNGCFLGNENCSDENPCAMHKKWSKVRESYMKLLKKTSLADLAEHAEYGK